MNQEKRYRRLVALYPRDHRERHGEEMLGVLLDGNGGWRDSLNLVGGAIALHLRRFFGLDGGVRLRDVMAVVSLLGPIVMLAGSAVDLHEIASGIRTGRFADAQIQDAVAWAAWLVVAVLALAGQRRAAAISAWFSTSAYLVVAPLMFNNLFFWRGPQAGWVLFGVFTAIALSWPPGPAHGRDLVGQRGILLAVAGNAVVLLVVTATPWLYGRHLYELSFWLTYGALALTGYVASRTVKNRRTGRRAAFVLALPALTFAMDEVLRAVVGPPLYWVPAITFILFYGVPTLMVLAGNGILRPVRKSLPS